METPLQLRNPSPEEVLDVLKIIHSQWVECDEAEAIEVDYNTSVDDWFWLGDDLSRLWVSNARWLNGFFEIEVPLREWKAILTPFRVRTVRDVCEFIARRATVIRIPKARILGRRCRTAGAFLAVRRLIKNAGVDTSNLMPSTPLSDYSASGIPETYRSIIRKDPNLHQLVRCSYRSEAIHIASAVLLLFATVVVGMIAFGGDVAYVPVVPLCFGGFVYVWCLSEKRTRHPSRVEFEGMGDFRDLCNAMVGATQATAM